jgi:predicted pyridoxine 5'-phosphate oxidase superfamily flavin-nucleotide-binding protein
MFDEYVKEPKSLDTLTLEQVSERIHSTNERTTRRWLEDCGVKVYRFARKSFVYQVEVEAEIDKPFVINLRNQYPDKWKERYRDVVKDLAVYNLLVSKMEDTLTPIPTARARNINKKDEQRYKRLLG